MSEHESLPTIKPVVLKILDKLIKGHKGRLQIADIGSGSEPKILLGINGIGNFRYYAVDKDKKRLEKLIRSAPDLPTLRTVLANAESLPFEHNQFDIVIFLETIEHLKNPEKALFEIVRISKAKGTIIISTPNMNRPDIFLKRLLFFIFRVKKNFPEDYYYSPDHSKEFQKKEFKMLLRQSGLIIKKWVPISYPLELKGFKSLATIVVYPFLNLLIKINPSFSPILFVVCKIKK